MFKSTIAALAAAPLFAGAAMAGPYVNVESNSGLTGSDYVGTLIETHVGYEGALSDTVSAYVQAGPAIGLPEGGDVSGKAGLSVAATDKLSVYGEYWFLTGDDLTSNIKAGVKYAF
jgi:hypothetical protein